jgi:hypothetical protein
VRLIRCCLRSAIDESIRARFLAIHEQVGADFHPTTAAARLTERRRHRTYSTRTNKQARELEDSPQFRNRMVLDIAVF